MKRVYYLTVLMVFLAAGPNWASSESSEATESSACGYIRNWTKVIPYWPDGHYHSNTPTAPDADPAWAGGGHVNNGHNAPSGLTEDYMEEHISSYWHGECPAE